MVILAFAQAVYFLITGLWPLVHMRSFLAVTGPKHDLWLVRTVGVIVAVIGASIALAACRNELSPPILLLAIGSAAGLMSIDIIYAARGVIPKIYLADAAAEAVLIAGWIICISTSLG